MGEQPRTEPDALKREYLAEGFRPIAVDSGALAHFSDRMEGIKDIEKLGLDVNISAGTRTLNRKGFKHAGHGTYVISPVDSGSKFTEGLTNCTSMIAVGREKFTGAEISCVTHQTQGAALATKEKEFSADIAKTLAEFKARCEEGSVDIIIAGGSINFEMPKYTESYTSAVEKLGKAVKDEFGFSPTVIGPKEGGHDNVYFNTAERKLYEIRPDNPMDPYELQPFLFA